MAHDARDQGTGYNAWAIRVGRAGNIAFNASSGATHRRAAHATSKLDAEGPLTVGCFSSADASTAGIDRAKLLLDRSTGFSVSESVQAP
jgi:hypothetical protein